MWNRKAREFGKRKLLDEDELAKFPPDDGLAYARSSGEVVARHGE